MSAPEHRDYTGAKLGMWLFLFTELILFGGLFILYAVYLHRYPREFAAAAQELSLGLGAANTVILLTGSLLVALSVSAVRRGGRRATQLLLWGGVFSGILFLLNKYVEWSAEIGHGIYPDSPLLNQRPPGEIIFFGLYYITLGLHGLHVLIGVLCLIFTTVKASRGGYSAGNAGGVEIMGLYWHFVDLVWIILFTIVYLI